MLHSNLLWLVGLNTRIDVEERFDDRSFTSNFLLSDVSLCREIDLVLMLNIHYNEDWCCSVSSEDIVDKNILRLELGTSCVPSHKLLLCVDLFEHIGHCFMVQVIQIPNVGLVWILLINHSIAVGDLDCRIDLFT